MCNDFKIDIHSFPALHSAVNGQSGKQASKFSCCVMGKALSRISP